MPRVWSSDEARIRNNKLSYENTKKKLDSDPEYKKEHHRRQMECVKKKDRYHNDEEYRLKTIENAKASYQRKKLLKIEIDLQNK